MIANDSREVFKSLGIPDAVRDTYEKKGLKQLYDWQRECLQETNVLRGENLVYCAPTSGGKTLVAELVLLKTVLSLGKKAIFVLPYVSLVREKEKHLKEVVKIYNTLQQDSARKVQVKAYYGEKKVSKRYSESIIVCTIEKANMIVNALIMRKRIATVGVLILDETHVLGNKMNGYLLELLMTKLVSIGTCDNVDIAARIQIIALSATMGNVHQLAQWLRAKLYITTFRPIPLMEYIKAGNLLLNIDGVVIDQYESTASSKVDPDGIAFLCKQGTLKGQQVIVFAPTKAACAQHCKFLSAPELNFNHAPDNYAVLSKRSGLIDALRQDNPNCEKLLLDGIEKGVAFHHSGLSLFERAEIEQAFRSGIISVLVATTTLAAGVNLPAGRVIIHSLSLGKDNLSVVNYKQMSGRAGRAGQTSYGESFLVVKSVEKEKAFSLVKQLMPDIISQFHPQNDGGNAFLKAAVESTGLGITCSAQQILAFVENTLLFHQCSEENKVQVREFVRRSVQFLVDARIVEVDTGTGNDTSPINITKFGSAMLQSGMDPDEAIYIYDALLTAQNGICLETPMHLLYLIAPLDHHLTPNFKRILQLYDSSAKSGIRAIKQTLDSIGVCPNLLSTWLVNMPSVNDLNLCTSGIKQANISHYFSSPGSKLNSENSNRAYMRALSVTKRLWAALLLQRIVEGYSYEQIAKEFKCDLNEIEMLHRSARIISVKCQKFCERMGWHSMEKLLGHFKNSLETEIPKEMLALLQIPKMTRKIAKVMIDNEIENPQSFLDADIESLVHVIQLSIGFEFQSSLLQNNSSATASKDETIQERIRGMLILIRESASEYIGGEVGTNVIQEQGESESESEIEDDDSSSEEGGNDQEMEDDATTLQPVFPRVIESSKTAASKVQDVLPSPLKDSSINQKSHLNVVFLSPAKNSRLSTTTTTGKEIVECVVSDEDLLKMMEEFENTGMLQRQHQQANVNGSHAFTYYPLDNSKNLDSECTNSSNFENTTVQEIVATCEAIDIVVCSLNGNNEKSVSAVVPEISNEWRSDMVDGKVVEDEVDDELLLAMMDEWERKNEMNQMDIGTVEDLDLTRIEDKDENANEGCKRSSVYVSEEKNMEKRVKFSPYLTPFTASKVKTPGKYFLVDISKSTPERDCHVNNPVIAQDDPKILLLDNEKCCFTFLQQLKACTEFAFELVFKSLPMRVLGGNIRSNHNVLRDNDKLNTWSSLVSLFCSANTCVTCNSTDLSLPDLLAQHHPNQKDLAASGANVLVGICISFDGQRCFYMSLPQLLPLRESMLNRLENSSFKHSKWNDLPDLCLESIATFVGFPKLLIKSPVLYKLLSSQSSYCYGNALRAQSNPMFFVSRLWCVTARRALAKEWRKGGALEWRLIQELFSCETVRKISPNIKMKAMLLRERDIIISGLVEDPALAHSILNYARIDATKGTTTAFPTSWLQVSRSLLSDAEMLHFSTDCCNGVIIASWRTITSFVEMKKLEDELIRYGQHDLFCNIEMPLQICVADSEFGGIEIDSSKLSKLRQGIRDRQVVLEYYFNNIIGPSFNFDSPSDVSKLKTTLMKILPTKVSEITAINTARPSSDWSAGRQIQPAIDEPISICVNDHPLMRVVAEYRSHSRTIPLLTSVLGSRRFARVRPCFNTIGAETGRLILSNPPLQQVPHECKYISCTRPTLQQEINQWTENMKDISAFLDQLNTKLSTQASDRNLAEWVKVMENDKLSAHKVGKLVRVLPFTVEQLYLKNVNMTTFRSQMPTITCVPSSQYLSDKPFQSRMPSNQKVLQVLVEFPGEEGVWTTCAANLVYRLNAGILPQKEEFELLKASYSQGQDAQTSCLKTITQYDKYFQSAEENFAVRESFVASEGYVFISADYSQIELRILAHLCEDSGLIDAFSRGSKEGIEVFRYLASQWKKKSMEDITIEERNEVKHLCYGVIYGAGVSRIAEAIDVDEGTAQNLCQDFMTRFPLIRSFINTVKLRCEVDGFSETLFGRKRILPHIQDKNNPKLKSRAQRQAVNTVCQGSAADIIKLAMINIHRKLEELSALTTTSVDDELKVDTFCFRTSRRNPGGGLYRTLDDARLVLQIHDELVYEVREKDVEKVAVIIKDCMENSVSLKIPLEAKLAVGKDWANMKPLELDLIKTGVSSSFKIVQNLFGNE